MKIIALNILFFLTIHVFGQATDSLGIDDNVTPNGQEAGFLNAALRDSRDTFDFTNKKLGFVKGSNGGQLVSKSKFFQSSVKPWTDSGSIPRISFVRLTDKEKQESSGYDAIVLGWVKVFTYKQQARTIERLKSRKRVENK